ncbi:MAG: leucine-rich repeat protein [Christensenellales bacterium]|jgi:hypothetical protein
MLDNKCPDCGCALEADKERDTAVCPECGKKYAYRLLKKEARDQLERDRWLKREEEKKKTEAVKAKSAVKLPRLLTIILGAISLAAFIAFCAAGDRLSFTGFAVPSLVLFWLVFAAFAGCAAWLTVVIKKYVYSGVPLYFMVIIPLMALLVAAIPVQVHAMHYYGNGITEDGYIYADVGGGVKIVEYRGKTESEMEIGGNIDGKTVVSIGDGVFAGRTDIVSIVVGEGVVDIGRNTFEGLTSLESLTLPSTLKSVGSNAFSGAEKLSSLTLPAGLETIGVSAFSDLKNIAEITLPDSVVRIRKNAFSGCDSVVRLTVPFIGEYLDSGNYTHIGYFFGAPVYDGQSAYLPAGLKSVTVTQSETIGANAFVGCSGLTEIVVKKAKLISDLAFGGCTGVAEFTIPATVESIGDSAFKNWTQAQTVYLPAGLDTSAWNKNWLAGCDAAVVEQ